MTPEKLRRYSSIQIDLDEMEYQMAEVGRLAVVQSICDFNLFWLSTLSTFLCRPRVVDFLSDHIEKFKRKLSVSEFMRVDFVIANLSPVDWEDFMRVYKAYTPELFYNLKAKSA